MTSHRRPLSVLSHGHRAVMAALCSSLTPNARITLFTRCVSPHPAHISVRTTPFLHLIPLTDPLSFLWLRLHPLHPTNQRPSVSRRLSPTRLHPKS